MDAKTKKLEIQAKIEYVKEIGTANQGSCYNSVLFKKIKYKASPTPHIDIRRYQRGYNENEEEVYFPTKMGFQLPEDEFRKVIRKYALLPETYIHPLVREKSFALFNSGNYVNAVLEAFKCIEIAIKAKISSDDSEFGVKLLRRVFNADNGELRHSELPKPEREAMANYIAGAYGLYKNPCSHREVDMDFVTAFERLVVASNILKMVNKE